MRRLPTYWYPVDPKARVVYEQPRRYRWQIYEFAGIDIEGPWQRIRSAVLGWPDRSLIEAAVLAVMYSGAKGKARDGWRVDTLRRAVVALYHLHGWVPPMRGFLTAVNRITHERMTETRCTGRFVLRAEAMSIGHPPCPLVAVRGIALAAERFETFDVVAERSAA